ncbi:MAG: hypothetical protein ACTSX4_07455 [Candidatus Helarchaeota archaeon]
MIDKKRFMINTGIFVGLIFFLIGILWGSISILGNIYLIPSLTNTIFIILIVVLMYSLSIIVIVFYISESKKPIIERSEEEKKKARKKKLLKLAIGIGIIIVFMIVISAILSTGSFELTTVIEFLISPLIIILLLEFSILGFFIGSALSRTLRKSLLKTTAIIGISLAFFNFILNPTNPISMVPNHPDSNWNHGSVVHILPAVSENRILLKTSFLNPLTNPRLNISETIVPGDMMDTYGYFWCFDARGLSSNTTYQLKLEDSLGNSLCDSWNLTTYPAPNSSPQHLRIVAFTGSGGHDACRTFYGSGQMPLFIRQKLLNKALSFEPDVLVASGDMIYYDLRYGVSSKTMGDSPRAIFHNGKFNPNIDILGTQNEIVFKNAIGPQIAYLFGTACKSISTYFILDDHDYSANDDAIESATINFQLLMAWLDPFVAPCITFPPDEFMLKFARAAQRLYLPEFLPDENRPLTLPATNATDRAVNVSECFGTLRYGDLVEGLMYDVRRYVNLTGVNGTFIPLEAEQWITDRCASEDATYVINFSPISFGWSAGKWLSWYPDVKTKVNGQTFLTKNIPKYMWQEGWFEQHNRILNASFMMENSTPLFVCGDMHAQAAGIINQSGTLNMSSNPIPTLLTGSLGVDGGGFPSGGLRGIKATTPTDLVVTEKLESYEKAGFIIMDINASRINVDFYGWRFGIDPISAIDNLQPHFSFIINAK